MSLYVQQKQIELLKVAFLESDYSDYLSYNTPYYSKNSIYHKQTDEYQVFVYEIFGEENKQAFMGYAIFINKLNPDKFPIATSMTDENDLTNLIVKTDEEVIYNHIEEMKKLDKELISITYGYSQYHGYYFIYIPKENNDLIFELTNYQGEIYDSFQINHQIDFDNTKSIEELESFFLENEYQLGFSNNQKINLIIKSINRNMIIYGIIVVFVGLFLFRKSFRRKSV